jgi:hypothetical protein
MAWLWITGVLLASFFGGIVLVIRAIRASEGRINRD